MNSQKLLCGILLCLGFSLVKAGAQTQPAASPATASPSMTTAASSPSGAAATATAAPTKAAAAPMADPQTPEEFFARARQLSDLEASGIPFHLKATYVATGDAEFTGNGTYEEWLQSKDLWRKEATLGDYKYVAMQNGGEERDYASSPYTPLRLRQVLDFSLVRIPAGIDKSFKWEIQHQTLRGMDLTVLSDNTQCPDATIPVQCVTKDYFTPEGMLRIHANDTIMDLYNDFQPFQGLLVPRSVTATSAGITILTISISELEALNPNEPQLSKEVPVSANMHSVAIPLGVKSGPGVKPSRLVHQVAPIYPSAAKRKWTQGTVVINASIDENGKVREPYVIASAGSLLDAAALKAVRHWKYEPLRINGTPYTVDTTISVLFAMNQ